MRTTHLILIVLGIAAAGVVGYLMPRGGEPTPPQAASPAFDHPGPDAQEGKTVIQGTVLETIEVPQYTYLRIATPGTGETWAAVSSPADAAEGQPVAVVVETRMVDFESKTLGRTFDSIYFGSLEVGGAAVAPQAPGGHGRTAAPAPAAVADVPIAEGDRGARIADVHARRAELSGKPVRVRGVVVKSTAGVMGRSFVHLRDGSGDAAAGTDDLTVTMSETPAVGDTLLVEGTVTVDKDFGAGYRYPVLLEDAQVVRP
jgi:hypothetical protein